MAAEVLRGRSLGPAAFEDQYVGIKFLAGFGEIAG